MKMQKSKAEEIGTSEKTLRDNTMTLIRYAISDR